MKLNELQKHCIENGYTLDDNQLNQFDLYAKFLKEYNQKINLTAIDEYEEVVLKHFYDSVLPLFRWKLSGKLADIGAGAGFPSIPLKIVCPDLEVTIVEPLLKRCIFLNELIQKLGLKNVTIKNERAEDYVKQKRESFDFVTARAVANLTVLSELCIPFVKVDGIFLVMKGQQGKEEYEVAKKAIALLGCQLEDEQLASLPDGSCRINMALKKVRPTPKTYPRAYGQIKKKPL